MHRRQFLGAATASIWALFAWCAKKPERIEKYPELKAWENDYAKRREAGKLHMYEIEHLDATERQAYLDSKRKPTEVEQLYNENIIDRDTYLRMIEMGRA